MKNMSIFEAAKRNGDSFLPRVGMCVAFNPPAPFEHCACKGMVVHIFFAGEVPSRAALVQYFGHKFLAKRPKMFYEPPTVERVVIRRVREDGVEAYRIIPQSLYQYFSRISKSELEPRPEAQSFEAGEGYRLLIADEVIEMGDEYALKSAPGVWQSCYNSVGLKVCTALSRRPRFGAFRRVHPIEVKPLGHWCLGPHKFAEAVNGVSPQPATGSGIAKLIGQMEKAAKLAQERQKNFNLIEEVREIARKVAERTVKKMNLPKFSKQDVAAFAKALDSGAKETTATEAQAAPKSVAVGPVLRTIHVGKYMLRQVPNGTIYACPVCLDERGTAISEKALESFLTNTVK